MFIHNSEKKDKQIILIAINFVQLTFNSFFINKNIKTIENISSLNKNIKYKTYTTSYKSSKKTINYTLILSLYFMLKPQSRSKSSSKT